MPTPAQEYQRLQSDVLKNQITVDGNTLQTRHQIAVLLDYLIQNTAHEILYSEFNQLFYDNFYDGSPSSKQKINNLKYETNSLLKGTRFEITKQSADRLALVLKT